MVKDAAWMSSLEKVTVGEPGSATDKKKQRISHQEQMNVYVQKRRNW